MSLRLLVPLLLCLLPASGGRAGMPEADSTLAEANQHFESAEYGEAVQAYQALVDQGQLSPELLYNLGVAKHRLGESGEAALWMRRALLLEPGMPEAVQSLTYLRSQLGYVEFAENPIERLLARLPLTFARWTRALCLWGALIILAAALLLPRLRPNRSGFVALSLLLFLLGGAAWWYASSRHHPLANENLATVVRNDTSALAAPAPEAKAVLSLPAGSEVLILQENGAWSYLELPGGLRGWARSESLARLWPLVSTDS